MSIDNWGSLQHFLPKIESTAIRSVIQQKQHFFHTTLVEPIQRLPSYQKKRSVGPVVHNNSAFTTMAGSSFQQMGSLLPLGRYSIPGGSSQEELPRQKRNKSSFGMYQSQRESMTLTPFQKRPYTKLMKNESEVGPRYTSPTKLSSVKELLKERRDLQRDDSANYVYAPKRAGKTGLAQILERKKRKKDRVLAPSIDEVNDSLLQAELLQTRSTQPVFIQLSTSRTEVVENVTDSQIDQKEESKQLQEPKLLRELREARREENLQE